MFVPLQERSEKAAAAPLHAYLSRSLKITPWGSSSFLWARPMTRKPWAVKCFSSAWKMLGTGRGREAAVSGEKMVTQHAVTPSVLLNLIGKHWGEAEGTRAAGQYTAMALGPFSPQALPSSTHAWTICPWTILTLPSSPPTRQGSVPGCSASQSRIFSLHSISNWAWSSPPSSDSGQLAQLELEESHPRQRRPLPATVWYSPQLWESRQRNNGPCKFVVHQNSSGTRLP